MSRSEQSTPSTAHRGAWFATTHWSVVLQAGQSDPARSAGALENLCRTYWYPLYAFVRRKGYAVPEAEDLTQGFFARLLSKNFPAGIRPEGGRFRSYLLTALQHYLANEWASGNAEKRGGGRTILSLQELNGEGQYQAEVADGETPESLYDRRWATVLLRRVRERLRQQYEAEGKSEVYSRLEPCLTGAERFVPYAELASQLNCSVSAVKMAVHRLRKRYGEWLRLEIAQTVDSPEAVEDEIRSLLAAL